MSAPVVILGLGFTTQRLARRLRQRGVGVYAAVRSPERFVELAGPELTWGAIRLCALSPEEIPKHAVLIHSIPPLGEPENSAIHTLIATIAPRRIVYISSTGIYGSQTEVNERTPAAPSDEKGRARVAEEEWLRALCTNTLILRSAAIYGPGRGIHVRLREGKLPRGAGGHGAAGRGAGGPGARGRGAGGIISRIHVEDLCSILEAGIESSAAGAWPVADDYPAASEEVAAWCANLMGLALPDDSAQGSPVAGRRVDGRKIREILGVELKYPSYHTGIPASLQEEKQQPAQ